MNAGREIAGYSRNEFVDFDETFGWPRRLCAGDPRALFLCFRLGRDRSDDRAARNRATYSWSRLIIDIYNGNKFHRDFPPVLVRRGNKRQRVDAEKEECEERKKKGNIE